MGANGFYIAEDGHFSPLLIPVDLTGGAHSSTVIKMGKYNHADIILMFGAAIRAAGVITLESCDDMTPTTHTELVFSYYASTAVFGAASDDIWGARTDLTLTTGFVPGAVGPAAATTGVNYLIPLEAAMLTPGHIGFRISMANPAAASVGCAFAILSGSRYAVDAGSLDV
jgi:hypothetical protein